MTLPNRIFFTGVPGSHWSGIAQDIEKIEGFNTSDRIGDRKYEPGTYTGHQGNYFGKGMEFTAEIDKLDPNTLPQYLDSPWQHSAGTKILKSHEWCYKYDFIRHHFPDDWFMMVYRPDLSSYAWWHEAGGFNIKYPSYSAYWDSQGMMAGIMEQNKLILEIGHRANAVWRPFSRQWLEDQLGCYVPEIKPQPHDILVTIIK